MTPQITTLGNGLRIVSHRMEHLETLSLGVWVATGARHEEEVEHGISHFLEHMAFKGTSRRSARAIAEEIESVGGDLNAATGLEHTAYFARVLRGDEGMALEILADILQNSLFEKQEVEREREVILQEIAATRDSPDDISYDLLQEAAFPGQAVGRTILGTTKSVKSFDRQRLNAFLARNYVPGQMVVSAAGAIDQDNLVRHVEALFGGLSQGGERERERARYRGGVRAFERRFEQSHLLLGFEGPSYHADDFFTAQVFSGLFGGGMSSRLFQEVRERRGLCYSIYSSAWALADVGLFSIHAATGSDMLAELSEVVLNELDKIAQSGARDAEVARAKAQLKAGLLMGLEGSGARAEQMARHLIGHDRLIPTEELIGKVDQVSVADVTQFAARMVRGVPSIVVVGAGRQSRAHAERLAERIGSTY